MLSTLTTLLKNERLIIAFALAISIISLAGAFTAEHVFDLEPCILCIYQRIPFALVIFFSLMGLMSYLGAHINQTIIGLNSVCFLGNAVIAFYHTGVERHWWKSFLEGCAVPDLGDDPEKILETILASPAVPCDEIPWADSFIGLSMANYNVMLCLGMFVICALSLRISKN